MFEKRTRLLHTALGVALAAGFVAPNRAATDTVPLPVPRPALASLSAASVVQPAPEPTEPSITAEEPQTAALAGIRAILDREARKVDLPPDIAEAVVQIESGYDPTAIGTVGEIGLMQVRPGTAAMLGFHGDAAELAKPEINIHYGVMYLGQAWHLANGDLCRALMKYRAGHGEEVITPLSASYCNRARGYLAALGSPFATIGASSPVVPSFAAVNPKPSLALVSPTSVYAKFKQGTPAASRAFWALQEARVRAITAQVQARWHRRMASR